MVRERWPSRLIFIFAAVGSAAGLGNLWRFPYMAYDHGGGAFLIPYFLALLIIGIPLLILEFGLGQWFQQAAVGSLRQLKSWGGTIGWWALGCGFIILSYYAVIMAWSLRYLLASFTTAWSGDSGAFFENTLGLTEGISTLGGFNWVLVSCLALVWVIIYFSIFKGIKSVSQVVKVTMPLPIILIFVLLIRALTLEGAMTGLLYLKPSFAAILDPQVWLAAASQIFFTLTLGFGVMIAYASYLRDRQDTTSNAFWTALLNSSISIVAGFVVFATLGFLAMQQGVNVPDVIGGQGEAHSSIGLAFVIFPEALSMMPLPWLFSILFFIVLLSLGIDSAFSLIEGITSAFKDRINIKSSRIALWASALSFLFGLIYVTGAGLYFLDLIDNFVTNYGLVLVGISQALLVGWTAGGRDVRDYIASVSTWFPTTLWWWLIRLVIPVILAVLLIWKFWHEIQTPYGGYPGWAIAIGWTMVALPLIVGWFLNKWYGKKSAQ